LRENEKSCDACAHSYMERENSKLRQKCRSPEYNASTYTHAMFMEDRIRGHCRFWIPKARGRRA
jgi:hypothetical protein